MFGFSVEYNIINYAYRLVNGG